MSIITVIAFIIGFFIGGQFGFIITCLLVAFGDEEERES